MTITDNARVVLERRISRKDENGDALESAEDIFRRVANHVAKAEENYDKSNETEDKVNAWADRFYDMLSNLDFIPNSPTLVNAGNELGQLSACFVLPVGDSIDEIFDSVKNAAKVHKTGGGTGFSFSKLRPAGSRVDSTSGIASGPVSFMKVFDAATEQIKQGGTRRGANMGILDVHHPDIREFITCKADMKSITNFNISVGVSEDFMLALKTDEKYKLNDGQFESAKEIWDLITENAWLNGDPGVIFFDRVNRTKSNPMAPAQWEVQATNPCGEQPLYDYDSCNLGSINLSNFIIPDGKGGFGFDMARLQDVVSTSVRFLDNVIDVNKYPLPEIEEMSKDIRRIGLGVMGWADALIMLGIKYDSDEAVELASEIASFISSIADQTSRFLGTQRGSFRLHNKSIYAESGPMRNSTRTTIAPTGTISIIAGCSSGIEPVFAFEFTRSHYLDKGDGNKRTELKEYHPLLKQWLDKNQGSEIPDYFVASHDISPEWHIKHQAAWQKYTDNAVSKTINMPKSSTVQDVADAYTMAYDLGCKGVTIYRDGSRENQVLFVGDSKAEQAEETGNVSEHSGRVSERLLPAERPAVNHKFRVDGFTGYISVGLYETGFPCEVFIVGNKTGSTTRGYLDTIGRLISLLLQSGTPAGDISRSLSGARFEPHGRTSNPSIPVATSIVDYVGRYLATFPRVRERDEQVRSEESGNVLQGEQVEYSNRDKRPGGNLCPECDGSLYYAEGCETCVSCGYSRCG